MKTPSRSVAPTVSLRIGSLVLPGYSARDGARLAGAFEQELGRLLLATPLTRRDTQAEVLRIPRFRTATGEAPERTGQRLARAVVRGLPR